MAANKSSGAKPGNKAPASGQYQQIGPKGGKGREVTVTKGEPLPPYHNVWIDIQVGRSDQE